MACFFRLQSQAATVSVDRCGHGYTVVMLRGVRPLWVSWATQRTATGLTVMMVNDSDIMTFSTLVDLLKYMLNHGFCPKFCFLKAKAAGVGLIYKKLMVG